MTTNKKVLLLLCSRAAHGTQLSWFSLSYMASPDPCFAWMRHNLPFVGQADNFSKYWDQRLSDGEDIRGKVLGTGVN